MQNFTFFNFVKANKNQRLIFLQNPEGTPSKVETKKMETRLTASEQEKRDAGNNTRELYSQLNTYNKNLSEIKAHPDKNIAALTKDFEDTLKRIEGRFADPEKDVPPWKSLKNLKPSEIISDHSRRLTRLNRIAQDILVKDLTIKPSIPRIGEDLVFKHNTPNAIRGELKYVWYDDGEEINERDEDGAAIERQAVYEMLSKIKDYIDPQTLYTIAQEYTNSVNSKPRVRDYTSPAAEKMKKDIKDALHKNSDANQEDIKDLIKYLQL